MASNDIIYHSMDSAYTWIASLFFFIIRDVEFYFDSDFGNFTSTNSS